MGNGALLTNMANVGGGKYFPRELRELVTGPIKTALSEIFRSQRQQRVRVGQPADQREHRRART